MNIRIRDYKEEDKNILLGFINDLEEYQKKLDPISRAKNLDGLAKKIFEQLLEDVNKFQGKILIAEDGKVTVGCIIGVIFDQSEINKLEIGIHKQGEILKIYLTNEYRRKGLGKLLIQKIEDYFKEKDCDSMWIEVSSFNTNAHSAYEKLGFADREVGMLKEI